MNTSSAARLLGDFDTQLLAQVEDAGLNASAPPQQRWMDGWVVRFSPGKAQRARCINAVALGVSPVKSKLVRSRALFEHAGLPLLIRITPFTQPTNLDAQLHDDGWWVHDATRVMVKLLSVSAAARQAPPSATSSATQLKALDAASFAQAVGALRGSSAEAVAAHAERLALSPVPYHGFAVVNANATLACAQMAIEGDCVGLYDVHTQDSARGHGLATLLCEHLLAQAALQGCRLAYLQVGAENHSARRIYSRLGFIDAYSYHYRCPPEAR